MNTTTTPSRSLILNLRKQLMSQMPFSTMSEASVNQFIADAVECYFSPDETILDPSSGPCTHLYFIRQGSVTATKPNASDDQSARQLEAGDLFPVAAAVASRAVTSVYQSEGDTFCLRITVDQMNALIKSSPVFADFLNQRIQTFLEISRQSITTSYASRVFVQHALEAELRTLQEKDVLIVDASTPLRHALQEMKDLNVGSVLVGDESGALRGILTRYDILDRVTLPQVSLDAPISQVMSSPVKTLTGADTAQDAVLLMSRHGIRHVPVVENGRVINIVSERDLFAIHRKSFRQITTMIRQSMHLEDLIRCAREIRELARTLLAQGVQAKQLTGLISHLNDVLCERLVQINAVRYGINLKEMCWICLGSEGRSEQTIATDQDNALIFVSEQPDVDRPKYLEFARQVNEDLDACGYPLCKGNVMASNPKCCLTPKEWIEKFARWIEHGGPVELLNASIYFDFRPLVGNESLARDMREYVTIRAKAVPRFVKQMADDAITRRVPLNWRGAIDTKRIGEADTIDLKMQASAIVVDAARIYALAHGVPATNTRERLYGIAAAMGISDQVVGGWVGSFEFIQMQRLVVQLEDRMVGGNPNAIDVNALNDIDRRVLKESLRMIRSLQQRLELDYRR